MNIQQIKNKLKSLIIKENRFTGHYVDWRQKRIAVIIKHYGEDFFIGKKILELGCGYGDIGAVFSKMGADVICSDARQEHLNVVKKRYPHIKTLLLDLDKKWVSSEYFDLIIDMGVLYHLENYKNHLEDVAKHADHIILETEVVDSSNPDFVTYTQELGFDQAFNGRGCRPSSSNIERILKENNLSYQRYDSPELNSGFHCYDWKETNSGTWVHGQRRLWFISSKKHS